MKKFYLLLIAVAAMTMTVQAQKSAQIDLGGFAQIDEYGDGGNLYNGGALCNAPINYYLCNSAAQIIYTAEDLAEAFDGKVNPKITKLSYKLFNEMGFDAYPRSIKVYAQLSDASAFGKDEEGNWIYFDFSDNDLKLSFEDEGDYVEGYYMANEFVIDLSNAPIALEEGKSLILTIVADGENATGSGSDLPFFCDNSRGRRVFAYGNDRVPFGDFKDSEDFPKANATLSSDPNINLPVTLIDYTYEEVQDYFLTGAFNNWGRDGNENIKFEANEDGDLAASVDLPAGENNGENGFKIITVGDDGKLVWYGGQDDNQVGYFEIGEDLLNVGLSLFPGDDYANLIVVEAGKYDLILKEATVRAPSGAPAKSPASRLQLTVKKAETITAVTDINVENIASVKYVNLAGQVSATPFDGVNIQVTTMKDGSMKAVKVIR